MRSLNLDQLRTLIEVLELGSFSAAARRLNLTQPAVSLQIRELERRFGVRLIERMGKQAHATRAGPRAGRGRAPHLPRLRARRRGDAPFPRRLYRPRADRHHQYRADVHLPPILRKLRLDHPGIDLLVTNMPTRESVEHIFENRLDLALVTLPVEKTQLRITPLRPRAGGHLPGRHAGRAGRDDARLCGAAAVADGACTGRRPRAGDAVAAGPAALPRAPMHLATIEALKTAVESNLGMSIVPDVTVADPSPDIIVRPLRPPVRPRSR